MVFIYGIRNMYYNSTSITVQHLNLQSSRSSIGRVSIFNLFLPGWAKSLAADKKKKNTIFLVFKEYLKEYRHCIKKTSLVFCFFFVRRENYKRKPFGKKNLSSMGLKILNYVRKYWLFLFYLDQFFSFLTIFAIFKAWIKQKSNLDLLY